MSMKAKYAAIAARIRDEIASGQLSPEDSLPSINNLAQEMGVNRSTVKRAYDTLIDEGLIDARQGKGYFVIPQQDSATEDSSSLRVFWSYAHKDDERTGGGITKLRERIQEEYELQTGDELRIFQDSKDIGWGSDWRESISNTLGIATFFIPILTPTYLRRPQCLSELRAAVARFEELGFSEGIYPIEFVDCTKAIERLTDDGLATLLSDRQRLRSWVNLRFEDPSSSTYSKGVNEIVSALLDKEREWDNAMSSFAETIPCYDDDEGEGLLEKVSSLLDALEGLEASVNSMGEDVKAIGQAFSDEKRTRVNSPRTALVLAKQIADSLDTPSRSLDKHCKEYNELMTRVSCGIDGLLELSHLCASNYPASETNSQALVELHDQVVNLQEMIDEPFSQIDSMRSQLVAFSKLSRVLREPCRRIDAALDNLLSSRQEIERWQLKLEGAREDARQQW